MSDFPYTYVVEHPQLSEPIEIDSMVERMDTGIRAWVTIYVLREFNVTLDPDAFTIYRR